MKLFLASVCLAAAWLSQAGASEPTKEGVKDIAELRTKAELGDAGAQGSLGDRYFFGEGIRQDEGEAVKWYRKAADQGHTRAQFMLGIVYDLGRGVPKEGAEALKWYRKAADQGDFMAQNNLGIMYYRGEGVPKDDVEALKWLRKAADQGDAGAQSIVGDMYAECRGAPKDYLAAYKWRLLAAAQGDETARQAVPALERVMTREQIAEGQKMAREFKPRTVSSAGSRVSREDIAQARPKSTGSGFFITTDGYFITNQHVADAGATVRVLTASGSIPAKVVKADRANDLALLKVDGKFTALPVIASRGARLGATVATVGFPNIGLQGFAPKLAKGEIASLAGAQDDARHFQISAPIQPGNSGGALVDERGNVIGVVVAKLNQQAALATSGTLAENVNYAVKSSYLLSFLESVPAVAAQLREPNTKSRPFEDVVKDVEQATVLVLVY